MTLICSKCKADNSDRRRFCRECGALIANFCGKCGFHNSFGDKYCGGCGSLIGSAASSPGAAKESMPAAATIPASAKYSSEDIKELIEAQSEGEEKKPKKKEAEDTGELSQDALDRMFEKGNG